MGLSQGVLGSPGWILGCRGSHPAVSPQTLVTAVVQLVVAEPGGVPGGVPGGPGGVSGGSWTLRGCGVACLVRDSPRRSYFIRIFRLPVSLGGPQILGRGSPKSQGGPQNPGDSLKS